MLNSSLYNETTFYGQFTQDLLHCKREVVIESPFITSQRTAVLYPIFERLVERKVNIYVITRDPREHADNMIAQSEAEIRKFEELGVQVFLCIGNDHRKLAVLDREILWEGSLNILSQTYSREIMRRIYGKEYAQEIFGFLKLGRYI